jgi:hypothetical protein
MHEEMRREGTTREEMKREGAPFYFAHFAK